MLLVNWFLTAKNYRYIVAGAELTFMWLVVAMTGSFSFRPAARPESSRFEALPPHKNVNYLCLVKPFQIGVIPEFFFISVKIWKKISKYPNF